MKNLLIVGIAVLMFSCDKNLVEDSSPRRTATTMEDLQIASSFNFETSFESKGSVRVFNVDDSPMYHCLVTIYDGVPEEGGRILMRGLTNSAGVFQPELTLPTYLDEVVVQVHAMGFPNRKVVSTHTGRINADFGGSSFKALNGSNKTESFKTVTSAGSNCYYISTYDSQGVPSNFESVNDVVDQAFLNMVNNSLPEQFPVPDANPHYLASGNSTEIEITQTADVWITFVHEGAGYKNTLGYYTYPSGNPPSSAAAIDSIFLLLPNASFANSGGGLYSGNKIHLGQFSPNTSIGWVLIQNAWDGNGVNVTRQRFYSNPAFNPESSSANRQHNVQLFDNVRDLILIGFEDLHRDYGSDDDFNDLVFYVTSNPVTAVSTINLPTTTEIAPDTDGDGVVNLGDDYPYNANKAFNNWNYGVLAFEDMWPFKGDYDFNDLVSGYAINRVTNADGGVVELNMTLDIRAIGAANTNALGFELGDLSPADVQNVSGVYKNGSIVTASGVEDGQTKAVFIAVDDVYAFLNRPKGAFFNTLPTKASEPFDTLNISITFSNPVSASDLGASPFNAFLVPGGVAGNSTRSEIHMAGYAPTSLVNSTEFGMSDDDSNPSQNRWYKTDSNLPWAINVASSDYQHVIEFEPIIDAYIYFAEWAETGGVMRADWYLPKAGYRDETKLFGN